MKIIWAKSEDIVFIIKISINFFFHRKTIVKIMVQSKIVQFSGNAISLP